MKRFTEAEALIEQVRGKTLSPEQRKEYSLRLAALMMQEANRIQTRRERKKQKQLANLVQDPKGKLFATALADQCFRSHRAKRIANQFYYLLTLYGSPQFLSPLKRFGFFVLQKVGHCFPRFLVFLIKRIIRGETASVILPGEPQAMLQHIQQRKSEGVQVNLNHLGEAILGEQEAERRLQTYLKDLANPAINYISIKISTLTSQLNLIAREETLELLASRLRLLYRAAATNEYITAEGTKAPKFVNLDMEEYRDLHLTVALFRKVLEEPEFLHLSAGIVLQSYLPDSFLIQQELTVWAIQRKTNGGAPIKIRIVKGANLAMEQVEASLRDWPQAPYTEKRDVDANFKRMVAYGCELSHARAAYLGIGSHNLFDIAYSFILCSEQETFSYVCFEMLEGMADPIRRVVQELAKSVLLYCPVATKEEFHNAVAYLTRRLDENTAPENFLRYAFDLETDSKAWEIQANRFSEACDATGRVSSLSRRIQNRFLKPTAPALWSPFTNEPDTDWSLPHNSEWAQTVLNEWKKASYNGPELIQSEQELDQAIQTAFAAQKSWSQLLFSERSQLLAQIAQGLREQRDALIGVMVADTQKVVSEADVEVSEAIDFAEYYRRQLEQFSLMKEVLWKPKGTLLIAPPWNFPCSIPAGGILAALAAGNTILFKPAKEAIWTGWVLANIFWKAGISRDVLQFVACDEETYGNQLIKDPRIAAVVLTGSTETARLLFKIRPGLDLMAETGGKNALIITSMSDRDLAVKDLVQSAFGHSGQKCSACSLAILEKEVYQDPQFRRQLKDAAESLKVGSAWDLTSRLNPLIRLPSPVLLRGLTTLEQGEEWLLQPKQDPHNPQLWSPGIKLGVKEGSFMHQTELFGPVLGVMCAENLSHALELANSTPYGLTAGIHSLDIREQQYWTEHIIAGNCYINRGITGAIVQRQPFGGCKASGFGRGAKAGGPNYLTQFMKAEEIALATETASLPDSLSLLQNSVKNLFSPGEQFIWQSSVNSYAYFWQTYFSKDHDPSHLLGEDNLLRYVPHPEMVLRVQQQDALLDILRVVAAAIICKTPLQISIDQEKRKTIPLNLPLIEENEEAFVERLHDEKLSRIRLLAEPSLFLQYAMAQEGCTVLKERVYSTGRLELLNYLREVSISVSYHRYGYLGERE